MWRAMIELKEINVKNCKWYFFDDITKIEDFDFDNILLYKKLYRNILIYKILFKTLIGAKTLWISFDKGD